VAQARTLAEARRILDAESIDVALLDLRMPDGSGTDLLDDARGFAAPPAFVVLSTFMTPQYVDAAIALGASGFLLKTAPIDEIVATVLLVAGGRLAFSVDQLRASRRIGWAPLTKREHAVIEGVIAGDSNDELSASLGVSRKTVEAYLSRLFARFGVLTRTELAVRAEREHWLELPIERRDPRVERRSPRQ
jgi:DNA-binding NarL/FixJ family response regulator